MRTNQINIIVACGLNRVIGRDGKLPWRINADWEYFLSTTKGGILIMGRNCYEEFKPHVDSHEVLVLSRNKEIVFPGARKTTSLSLALKIAEEERKTAWICGGQKIYEEALPIAHYLYLTKIYETFSGDVHFPAWESFFNREISRKTTSESGYRLEFLVFAK